MGKRLFIAADVSDETRALIRAIQSELHFYKGSIRFVIPQNVHLTLKFLGDVPEEAIPEIEKRIAISVSGFQKFNYICRGTGVFPNVRKPRVLWLGIVKGNNILKQLSNSLQQQLKDMPVQQDDKEFRSHVTIGRIRNYREHLVKLDEFLRYNYGEINNPVSEIVLYESMLLPKGPIYTSLKKFKLQ